MATSSDALGGRLPLLKPADLTGAQKAVYDLVDTKMVPWAEKAGFKAKLADGRLVGPFNTILFSPDVTKPFLDWQAAEGKHTTLTERERQVVILTVGAIWKCDYERYAHRAVARGTGLSEAAIAALAGGEPAPDLSPKEQLAQRFTARLIVDRRIDDGLYAETEAAFEPEGVVDMICLAGQYMTVSSLLNAFEVPVPD